MKSTTMPEKFIHQGHNVKRIRELLGVKQEALAIELGDDWNQQKISLLEQKEVIEPGLLEQVAKALKVPADAVKNFSEEAAINVISNTFNSHDSSTLNAVNYYPTFNPLEKVIELFERLLASEKEKTDLMKEILNKLNK
jgi:transcriptional regulator with XRE-family HTH domain